MTDIVSTAAIVFLLGMILTVCFASLMVWDNWRRMKQALPAYDLRPNCLLTKNAILFITGRKSLIYFLRYWNGIPHYLADHGYQVFVLRLPWRRGPARREMLTEFLSRGEAQGLRFHVVSDNSALAELEWLAQTAPRSLVSCHAWGEPEEQRQTKTQPRRPEDLRPPRIPIQYHDVSLIADQSSLLHRMMVDLHRRMGGLPKTWRPELVGWVPQKRWQDVADRYLTWAAHLAERDYREPS